MLAEFYCLELRSEQRRTELELISTKSSAMRIINSQSSLAQFNLNQILHYTVFDSLIALTNKAGLHFKIKQNKLSFGLFPAHCGRVFNTNSCDKKLTLQDHTARRGCNNSFNNCCVNLTESGLGCDGGLQQRRDGKTRNYYVAWLAVTSVRSSVRPDP